MLGNRLYAAEAARQSSTYTTEGLSRFRRRLLLDSRVVDVLRLPNLILVILSSLKPLFFNGLKKALHFSDNVGA
jgi:hypothetical protein